MEAQLTESVGYSDTDDQNSPEGQLSNLQFVTFSCDGKNCGVEIMAVREIRSWAPVTGVPDQPNSVRGVLDIRGEIVQIYDLSSMLGGARTQESDSHVVLIVSIEENRIGLLVDSVSDIISVAAKDMRPPPPNGSGATGVMTGMAKYEDRLFSILDLSSLI